jgi:NAD-dependent oxidoreductase involved in siderophore biosynthesis
MKRYEGVIWSQGYFVDQRQYRNWTQEQKAEADYREKHLVRPSPTGNAICQCNATEDAKWIAEQLNKASDVEALIAERDAYCEALEEITEVYSPSPVKTYQLMEEIAKQALDEYKESEV